MALEGRCKRASRKAFKIGLHKFSAHVPPPLCLTDYFAEGLEPDYRDRPSSITVPPGGLAAVSGRPRLGRVARDAGRLPHSPHDRANTGNKILGVNAATAELVSTAFRNEGPVRFF